MNEVLLYGAVYSWSAKEFIESVNKADSTDLTVRVNGDGGELKYGWGCVSKLAELENVRMVNDGEANSMFAFAFCYGQNNEAADFATFMFHRAAYPQWYEQDPQLFSEADKSELVEKNKKLRAAFEARVDVAKWEDITGVSVDELFSLKGRVDVVITAKQAKQVGLIDRINTITPKRRQEIAALREKIEAKANPQPVRIAAHTQTTTTMNLETLQAEHSALYNQIFEKGRLAGIAAEKDRVEAILTFVDADPKACVDAVASGQPLSQKQMADFARKLLSVEAKKDLTADSSKETPTGEPPVSADDADKKALEALADSVKKQTSFFNQPKI